jgi:FkbM family methyltransferase
MKLFNEIIALIKRYIKLTYNKYIKYRVHGGRGARYNLASDGESIRFFADWIKEWSTLKAAVIVEIGANFAQDADVLRRVFKVNPENVYVFEPHPEIYEAIKKIHKFNAYNYAVYNEEKDMPFNIVPLHSSNTGVSSLHKLTRFETKEITVKSIRMDNFMTAHGIDKIDFLKIDVEGANFEVLKSFGTRITDVNAVHIEAEHINNMYNGDIFLFDSISDLLVENGFDLIYFQRYSNQSDSFWIQKRFIKNI